MKKEEYSLVYKAIHGDSHAYGELIHQYNPYFYKIAFLSLYKKSWMYIMSQKMRMQQSKLFRIVSIRDI